MSDDPTPAVPDDPSGLGAPADPGAGGFDLGGLLEQAMSMQSKLAQAQQEAASTEVEGQAGGGVVRVVVTGGMEFRSVHIDPQVVDPDDVEMLQDLVLAALRDAAERVGDLGQSAMGEVDLGGLGDLGGMLGLGGDQG
jgi:DNA-binding YbaB/EbfC family protein